jgi:hypothetical protein
MISFSPILVLLLDPGFGMDKNQDPGSGINIPDPQHWLGHTGVRGFPSQLHLVNELITVTS